MQNHLPPPGPPSQSLWDGVQPAGLQHAPSVSVCVGGGGVVLTLAQVWGTLSSVNPSVFGYV